MEKSKILYVSVLEGVLRGFFMTLAILINICCGCTFCATINESITSILIIIATLLSVSLWFYLCC